MLTVSFDASMNAIASRLGIAAIARDDERVIAWSARCLDGVNARRGEHQAARAALVLAQSLFDGTRTGFDLVGDGLSAIKQLKAEQRQIKRSELTEKNREYFWALTFARLAWIKREENSSAHNLANWAIEQDPGTVYSGFGRPPA